MTQFRIRAASFDAVQWAGDIAPVEAVVQGGAVLEERPDHLRVITALGAMRAAPGDWIVRDHRGGVIACKPAVFATTYEAMK